MTGPVPAMAVAGLTQRFGGRAAVDEMDVSVASGESIRGASRGLPRL